MTGSDGGSPDWRRLLAARPGDEPGLETVPAAGLSRQQWQREVEHLIVRLRHEYGQPAFGVSEADISVHYHLPAERFVRLVRRRLGMGNGNHHGETQQTG